VCVHGGSGKTGTYILNASISLEAHIQTLLNFCACYPWLWLSPSLEGLWCITYYTSGLVDDVIFSHNGHFVAGRVQAYLKVTHQGHHRFLHRSVYSDWLTGDSSEQGRSLMSMSVCSFSRTTWLSVRSAEIRTLIRCKHVCWTRREWGHRKNIENNKIAILQWLVSFSFTTTE